jgi:hypothetical protein
MKHFLVSMLMVTASSFVYAQPIVTDSTSRSTAETTLKSPPPTAVAPAVTTINNDVCAVAASGAVQTQILGISMGGTMRDMNCERIKLSKNLYDMGMKVAAVATLCQDERIFTAMNAAGTPCPVDGKIGQEAKDEWEKRGVITKGTDIGFYGAITPKKSEVKKEQFICKDYAGNDPAVKERLGCK